jgi:hypothetical protein
MGAEHRTSAYQVARLRLKALEAQPCVLCGGLIDYGLSYPDGGSFAAEHIVPVRAGGDHRALAPSHLGCQRSQGGTVTRARLAAVPDRAAWITGVW